MKIKLISTVVLCCLCFILSACGVEYAENETYSKIKQTFSETSKLNYREDVFYSGKETEPLFIDTGVIENKTLDNFIDSISSNMPKVDIRRCNYRFEWNTGLGKCFATAGTEDEFSSGKLSEYCDYNETYTIRYYIKDSMVYDYCEHIELPGGKNLVHSLTISEGDISERQDSK